MKHLLVGLFVYLFIGLLVPLSAAQTMSSSDFILKTEELDPYSDPNRPNLPNNPNVLGTKDQKDPNILSEGVNFVVRSGFENPEHNKPVIFSLSSNIVDFGALSPTNPITRILNLNIANASVYGYSALVYENHSLADSSEKRSIPDITCDNGRCTHEKEDVWNNVLTYGFGYRCDNLIGSDCSKSFTDTKSFKQFPNISRTALPQAIMHGKGLEKKEVKTSYKVNISGTQPIGNYTNVITYLLIPNY
jgi:hypothetical protein